MGRPKITTEIFINRSKTIHNLFYNYDKTVINGIRNKVIITCPIHGDFNQAAYSHLNGSRCSKCSGNSKLSHDEFVNKSNVIHNSKYEYITEYNGHSTKIEIKCNIHGIFKQTPNDHLSGKGCPCCANNTRSIKKQYDINDFITKSNQVHDNKYSYIDSVYVNSKTKIKIICPEHGEYYQLSSEHIRGKGCKNCNYTLSRAVYDIKSLLEESNVIFTMEHKFEDCINVLPLPFDFYIPYFNICIEYDGEQHFISKEHWGGDDELSNIQFRDSIKTEYCKNKNINLIRISYLEDHNSIIKNLIGELYAKSF